MEIFGEILVNDIFPIFLVGGVGWLIAHRFPIDVKMFSQVAINTFLPCLIFQTLSTTNIDLLESGRIGLFCILVVGLSALLAWLASRLLRSTRMAMTSLMLVVMFTNVGNFGLPVVTFAFGNDALAHATVYFVTMNILLYTVGIALLSRGKLNWKKALASLLREPVIYGIVLAVIVGQFSIELPESVSRSVNLLAQAAIPSMLLVLGMRFAQSKVDWNPALGIAVLLRLIIVPLIAFPLAHLLQLSGPALQAGMIQSATPSGVSTTILATEYDIEPDFVNSAVFISTLSCALTLTPLVLIIQEFFG